MTIAAGFVCSDGVLLASDTLYSNTGMGLKYGRKFWILDHGDVLVAFGGSGMEAALLRTRDEIDRKLNPGMSRIKVVDTIDTALKKVHDKLPDHPDWKTYGLVVVRVGDVSVLYENAGGSNMLSPVQHKCQCVGYGRSLGWYFASTLFAEGASIKTARIVAAHLIKNVKEYSASCGGDTHLFEVPNIDSPREITNQDEIEKLELHLAPLVDAIKMMVPDGVTNQETIELRMRTIASAIAKAERTVAIT